MEPQLHPLQTLQVMVDMVVQGRISHVIVMDMIILCDLLQIDIEVHARDPVHRLAGIGIDVVNHLSLVAAIALCMVNMVMIGTVEAATFVVEALGVVAMIPANEAHFDLVGVRVLAVKIIHYLLPALNGYNMIGRLVKG